MKILMVEDSPFFGSVFRKQLEQLLGTSIDLAISMQETVDILARQQGYYDAAILDLDLPDAHNGEIVPLVLKHNIPAIVFTANVTDEVRQFVWKHKVVDYVVKSNSSSLDYLASLLRRISKNKKVQILVVDDSSFFRKVVADLLKVQQLQVLTAKDGEEALAVMGDNPAVKMVITDYNMPKMDGVTLTENLRKEFSRDQLAIIGVSAEGDAVMAARFIKSGANDFIIKQSFLPEEFYCRVNQNLDFLDHVFEIKEAATRDHLTGLYNRRYFFTKAALLVDMAHKVRQPVSCGMLDIDYFKNVNDTYGHQVGDVVLQKLAQVMIAQLRGLGVVARMGGEEFCVVITGMGVENTKLFFITLCEAVASTPIDVGGDHEPLRITVSIGVVVSAVASLDELIRVADQNLYLAKEQGRNRVVMSKKKPD